MTILDRLARIVLHGTQAELEAWARDYQAKQGRRKAKQAPRVQREKATKAQRADNWQTIREAVMRRADGRCESCKTPDLALDAHHLLGGPERRKWESVTTVVGLCRLCHRDAHDGERAILQRLIGLAARMDAPYYVQAKLNRRLEKVIP
jgi:5-methylcytosine-specific restriction endonuclease McrA